MRDISYSNNRATAVYKRGSTRFTPKSNKTTPLGGADLLLRTCVESGCLTDNERGSGHH